MALREIDFDRYLPTVVSILNEDGTRSYDEGIRVFNCPICGEDRGRGWASLERRSAGCFNAGCDAEPRLDGGLFAWVQRVEQLADVETAILFLRAKYLAPEGGVRRGRRAAVVAYTDWCRWPVPQSYSFRESGRSMSARPFVRFAVRQWGLGLTDLETADAYFATSGRHADRILFPVRDHDGVVIAFQARTIVGADPKYRTSQHGTADDPNAECGRPAEALVYGLHWVGAGGLGLRPVVLVEGIGDALRIYRVAQWVGVPIALLGVQLSDEKAALVTALHPPRVIVALDQDAEVRAREYALLLAQWGVEVGIGTWAGGKDAGSGAQLAVDLVAPGAVPLHGMVTDRLKGRL